MKFVVALLCLVSTVAAGSVGDRCHCHGFTLVGDGRNDVFSIEYPHTAGCGESGNIACKEQCRVKFGTATNGGDLNARPALLKGLSVGDFICLKLRNVQMGRLAAFARVCDNNFVDTGLRGREFVCCSNGVRRVC